MSAGSGEDVLLAFDFGLRRIGVASANVRTRTASPLATLQASGGPPWAELDALITDWAPGRLIVGVPDPEGSPGAAAVAGAARAFAASLAGRYSLPVETVDESFTSAAAEAELREGRRSGALRRRVRRDNIDRRAACLIAEQWMNGERI